jgi:hypothetical protein
MTVPTQPLAAGASAALTAVLRETGPRALAFAELLCGGHQPAEAAMTAAVQALRGDLVHGPLANWTGRFWSRLVGAASARQSTGQWPPALAALAMMGPAVRAAFLLHTVARLDDAEAAAVLGVGLSVYRRALQRGLPRGDDGRVDAAALRGLLSACEQAVRAGADPRAGRLDRLFAMAAQPQRAVPRSGWQGTATRIALGACALALAATWLLRPTGSSSAGDDPSVRAVALAAASDPASTFDAETGLVTHPDFDAAADASEQSLVESLDFYAWYAARIAGASEAGPQVFPDAGAPATGTAANPEAPGASR